MLENFIYAKRKSLFEEKLNNGEVLDESIAFIEDTKEIWNHGTYFATRLSIDEIENIVSSSETVQSVMEQVVLDTLDSLPVSIVSDGDGSKFLADDGSYKEIVVPTKVSELEDDLSIVTLNDSTPIAESLVGDELIPIKQNGEDKAVTATDLIKDAKELFEITPNSEGEFPTILTKDYLNNGLPVINAGAYLTKSFTRSFIDMGINFYEDYYIVNPAFKSGEKASVIKIVYVPTEPDRPISLNFYSEENIIPLFYDGDGTKFLADDGTYKEVSGGSEPYNFDTNKTEFTEEELEEFLTAVSSGTPIMSYMDGINIPFSVVPRFSSGETIGYYLIAIVGDMESGNNPLLFYIYISKSDRSITSKTASDGSVHHIATEESVNALAPYIWNGTTSETIYYEIIDCIVSGRTIMYSRTDTNDDGLYHICTSSAIGSQTAYLTFSDTYRHGTFKMLVTEDQVLRVQGLIPFYSCDSGSNTSIEAGTYNSVNIKNNTEIVYDTTINGVQQRYEGEFSFGDTVYTVTFPDTVTWTTIPESYKPDTTYQFKILNNIGNIWEVGKGEVAYKSDIPTKVNDLEDGPSIVTSIEEAKEVFIVTSDMFEETATVGESPYITLTFTDDGLNKFKEAVEANKIIGIDKAVFNLIENSARPFTAVGPGNYVFSTYVGVMEYGYALSFELLNTITADIDRYDVSIISKDFSCAKNMSADGSFYLDTSMFVEPAAGETAPGLELMEDYEPALYRAIDSHKIIKINYNILAYLDMIATPYAGYTPEGYFILDNILKTSDTAFQATVIVPETNYHLTIYYNNGIFTADKVDMSDIYILDDYMFIETAGDTPITSIELIESYKQSLTRAIGNNRIIGISNLLLYYLTESIATSNVNTRALLPNGFSIINIDQFSDIGFIGHVYYGIDSILLRINCVNGVITIEKETRLLGSGDGTKFLADNGEYKTIDLATSTTSGLMSAEDKTKLDQITSSNTSIVTQAEYDALVAAGATTSGSIYYIRG